LIERLSLWTTVGFGVTAVGALATSALRGVAALVALAMFLVGMATMLAAIVVAAGRSRTALIDVGGLFFLSNAAPKPVQRLLFGAFGAQVVIGLVTAAARPNTASALGALAPVAGLGFMGLWGARHGTFPARDT
jgi:hypothetical protein